MAVPKRRHCHARSGRRSSQKGLVRSAACICPHCNSATQPHRICQNCGQYAGRQILNQGK